MTAYYRLSGGGNDFLALVEPADLPTAAQVAAWCRRGVSLGADGVLVLDRTGDGIRTRHFNADGQAVALCLNGTRCAVRLAALLGWVDAEGQPTFITTGVGTFRASLAGSDRVRIALPPPVEAPRLTKVRVGDDVHAGWLVSIGVPHFVMFMDHGLHDLDLTSLAPALRYHETFAPAGANINWIQPTGDGFALRTWERGVEGETLACGTGTLAAAAAVVAAQRGDLPLDAVTRSGFVFTVEGQRSASDPGTVAAWDLIGDARVVARGTILPGAAVDPA